MVTRSELIGQLHASVDKCQESLIYAAPELWREHFARLRANIEADVNRHFDKKWGGDDVTT